MLEKLLTKYKSGGVLSEKEILQMELIKKHMEKLSDLKITLSTKLYDLVDEHMKTGCKHLKSLENVVAAKRKTASALDVDSSDNEGEFRKRDEEVVGASSHLSQRLKVDESEPLYCTCRQVNSPFLAISVNIFLPVCLFFLTFLFRLPMVI